MRVRKYQKCIISMYKAFYKRSWGTNEIFVQTDETINLSEIFENKYKCLLWVVLLGKKKRKIVKYQRGSLSKLKGSDNVDYTEKKEEENLA